ncbi:hypothetical protein O6H91_19G065700 [Diphasiastrum complanatum]|uniref:Uncharacterized protein n=1 Tax=Diphasiastrum complanatum TaxID=34168 RepID=A0ACC2AXD6_DIPCM|nr:hypothetical protein O6H91_19G065700 [Diphasiastrum complanatum]
MDDRLFPRGYSQFMPDPEDDLEEILKALERKTTIELTVSLPTTLVESSTSESTSSNQITSRGQLSSMAIRAPFFSSLVASTNSVYSFEQKKPQSDAMSSQASVCPHKTFTDMLSSEDEFLWSDFRSSNCQDLYNYSNQSISLFNPQTSESYEDSRYAWTGEDDEAKVAAVSTLQISNSRSFKESISDNWELATHIASTSDTFHGKSPFSSEPPSITPGSFMFPSSSEDSDEASNKDEGAAASDREPKRMTLEKPSVDETADTAEGKKTARKVQKKAIKRQRGPRYALRTRSDVEVMDDGYRWRKYGQKAVKNSPYPRSYYRCTNLDCKVKKRVERSAEDAGLVITTYEGVHTHHCPAALIGGFPLFPFTYFREASLPHLPFDSTASAPPHSQLGILPIRGQLQPSATDQRLLEDLLLYRTTNNS